MSKQHVFVYLDIAIDKQPIGTLLFEVWCCEEQQKQRAKIANVVVSLAKGGGTKIRPVGIGYEFHVSPLTLTLQLFSDVCPKTCENFRALCVGGVKSPYSGRELTYKNSCFHQLVKNGWIQGGGVFPNSPNKWGSQQMWDGMI